MEFKNSLYVLTVTGTVNCQTLYAYHTNFGLTAGYPAWDGTHGVVIKKGSFSASRAVISDTALDYAFDKWGKQ